jgi:hypothetical protein
VNGLPKAVLSKAPDVVGVSRRIEANVLAKQRNFELLLRLHLHDLG